MSVNLKTITWRVKIFAANISKLYIKQAAGKFLMNFKINHSSEQPAIPEKFFV